MLNRFGAMSCLVQEHNFEITTGLGPNCKHFVTKASPIRVECSVFNANGRSWVEAAMIIIRHANRGEMAENGFWRLFVGF
jgi:hypothetical protein